MKLLVRFLAFLVFAIAAAGSAAQAQNDTTFEVVNRARIPIFEVYVSPSAIDKHLQFGDSRAAVVVSVSPLLVAAYSDERDCVVMLKFPEELVATYRLKPGSRLITVNTYMQGPKRPVADLIEGPLSRGNWHNVIPMIADFLSDDTGTIETLSSPRRGLKNSRRSGSSAGAGRLAIGRPALLRAGLQATDPLLEFCHCRDGFEGAGSHGQACGDPTVNRLGGEMDGARVLIGVGAVGGLLGGSFHVRAEPHGRRVGEELVDG